MNPTSIPMGAGQTVVITGVAGFIGHHTAAMLLDHGYRVVGIDSFTDYYDPLIKYRNLEQLSGRDGFSVLEATINGETASGLLGDALAIIHLAAQPGVRDSWRDFDTYVDRNVRATKAVLDAALANDVERVVCASSSSVYGNAPSYPTREDGPLEPRSPYGITKLAAERLAVAYGTERGLSTVSLRYFTVYGPGQRPDMAIQRMLLAAYSGNSFPMYGDGTQVRDFTFVGDVARANCLSALCDVEPGEVFNVCSEYPVTLNDVIEAIETATGRPIVRERHDVAIGDVVRTGGSADHIRRVLGWESLTPLMEGIAQQAAAVRRAGEAEVTSVAS